MFFMLINLSPSAGGRVRGDRVVLLSLRPTLGRPQLHQRPLVLAGDLREGRASDVDEDGDEQSR